jgi:hypothetical protein
MPNLPPARRFSSPTLPPAQRDTTRSSGQGWPKATAWAAQSVLDGGEHAVPLAQVGTSNISRPGSSRSVVKLRCDAVAVGRTYPFPPLFVWGCLNRSIVTPFPHPAHRTRRGDFPHPALGQVLTPFVLGRDAFCSS